MYISPRAVLIRNFSVSLFNRIITLVISLIAPLEIVIVIINILLITVTTVGDRVVTFLQRNDQPAELISN